MKAIGGENQEDYTEEIAIAKFASFVCRRALIPRFFRPVSRLLYKGNVDSFVKANDVRPLNATIILLGLVL